MCLPDKTNGSGFPMRSCFLLVVFAFSLLLTPDGTQAQSDECDVQKTLEARELPIGSLAIDGYGDVVEASHILVPIALDKGRYEVTVTQEANNLYSVSEANIYLQTTLCLELATVSSAVLEVISDPSVDYSFGTLHFLD